MERLANAPEMLDGPLDARTLAGNLRDLQRVNRWLGGAALSWQALVPFLSRDRQTTLLDVGTGAGDIPRQLLRRAAYRYPLVATATDVRPEIVAIAGQWARRSPSFSVTVSPPGQLQFEDASFDIVHSSMLLHHLDPSEAIAMLREMKRVCRRAVIVNDLERGRLWWLGAWLLSRVATRNAYTRNDAPLSVRRAYRADELVAHGAAAGLRLAERRTTFPAYRFALTFVPADAVAAGAEADG